MKPTADAMHARDTNQRYRIGVIGAGARGEAFARQLHKGHERAQLAGVCDIDADRLGKFCEYCGLQGAPRFTDLDEFLHQPGLDAVMITTPDFTHADVATAAMRAGKPVYIEKPLAHTLEDCHRILDAQRDTGVTAYLGFNLRALPAVEKLKEIVASGTLGQVVFVSGLEILTQAHGAAYMRRFHRRSSQSGGLLNHKSSHDLDIMLWVVGHEHNVTRVSSFGGTNVFRPDKQPAARCGECPPEIYQPCPYKAAAGFTFPIGAQPMYKTVETSVYGTDLCVYDPDKDIVDNQVVILEWDHGVRGSYALQMFQSVGRREIMVVGEKGTAELRDGLRVTLSDSGESMQYSFTARAGGHGGADGAMIGRFVAALDSGQARDSGLEAGLAATTVALKADQSRLSGSVVDIARQEYCCPCR